MKKPTLHRLLALAASVAFAALPGLANAQATGLGATGYSENFDSMGAAGNSAPAGWTVWTASFGSNSTWTTTIPGNGSNSVASLQAASGSLTATASPSGTNNNGFNAAFSAAALTDRLLAISPTTYAGGALQLQLSNDSGAAFSSLVLSYETRRYGSASTVNELPGYWLFFSLDGSSWSNVAALNPSIADVPNSAGVSSFNQAVIELGASVAPQQQLWLRWVDDNARQTSPDQIIGLNNVSIAAVVPEPSSLALLALGLVAVLACARPRKA